jgi:hypothetical protein
LPTSGQSPPSINSADQKTAPIAYGSAIVALSIPGPRDVAVRKYSEWQQSKVVDETLRVELYTHMVILQSDTIFATKLEKAISTH